MTMEEWNNGMMEYWGKKQKILPLKLVPIVPIFQ
jgi:hypothetical protein